MLTLSSDNKRLGKGIGTINILLIAVTGTVLGGILLLDTKGSELADLEMQQYLLKQVVKLETQERSIYNPFALAKRSPDDEKKAVKKSWVVSDEDYKLDYTERNILHDLIGTTNEVKGIERSSLSKTDMHTAFDKLNPIKHVLARYYKRHQQWPITLQDAGLEALETNPSSSSLSGRGTLTVWVPYTGDIIRFSANTKTDPITWFCETTIQNQLLGQGVNRLCIHSKALNSDALP